MQDNFLAVSGVDVKEFKFFLEPKEEDHVASMALKTRDLFDRLGLISFTEIVDHMNLLKFTLKDNNSKIFTMSQVLLLKDVPSLFKSEATKRSKLSDIEKDEEISNHKKFVKEYREYGRNRSLNCNNDRDKR